jgi:hypothetical protein
MPCEPLFLARADPGGNTVRFISYLIAALFLAACQSNGGSPPEAGDSAPANAATPAAEDAFHGKVIETMNAGGYTYVHVDTGSEKIWAAGPQQEMAVGTDVNISKAMPMQGFQSETLERTFDVLYFVSEFGDHTHAPGEDHAGGMPAGQGSMGGMPAGHGSMGGGASAEVTDFSGITVAGQTVADVYAQKQALSGQQVQVRGKVVKSLSGIMGTNWLHIQDGTGEAGANDLTVTSDTVAPVGATVLVEGVLVLDKDFGSGYRYAVIVENATVTVE